MLSLRVETEDGRAEAREQPMAMLAQSGSIAWQALMWQVSATQAQIATVYRR